MRAPNFGVAVIYLSRCSLTPPHAGGALHATIHTWHTDINTGPVGICSRSLHTLSARTKASAFQILFTAFQVPPNYVGPFLFLFFSLSLSLSYIYRREFVGGPSCPISFCCNRTCAVCVHSFVNDSYAAPFGKECIPDSVHCGGMWEHRTDCSVPHIHTRVPPRRTHCVISFVHFLQNFK